MPTNIQTTAYYSKHPGGTIDTAIDWVLTQRSTDLVSALNTLSSRLAAETTNRTAADSDLLAKINNLKLIVDTITGGSSGSGVDWSADIEALQTAVNALRRDLENEATNRADEDLSTRSDVQDVVTALDELTATMNERYSELTTALAGKASATGNPNSQFTAKDLIAVRSIQLGDGTSGNGLVQIALAGDTYNGYSLQVYLDSPTGEAYMLDVPLTRPSEDGARTLTQYDIAGKADKSALATETNERKAADVSLAQSINALKEQLNTYGDSDDIMAQLHRVADFLAGVTDTDTLMGMLDSLDARITAMDSKLDNKAEVTGSREWPFTTASLQLQNPQRSGVSTTAALQYDPTYNTGGVVVSDTATNKNVLLPTDRTGILALTDDITEAIVTKANKHGSGDTSFAARRYDLFDSTEDECAQLEYTTGQKLNISATNTGEVVTLDMTKSGELARISDLPSDDHIRHEVLVQLVKGGGATYNATTGYWELNGLTDITEEQMWTIFYESGANTFGSGMQARYYRTTARTNLFYPVGRNRLGTLNGSVYDDPINIKRICIGSDIEVLKLCTPYNQQFYGFITGDVRYAFSGCTKLKTIIGNVIMYNNTAGNVRHMFDNTPLLETVNIGYLKCNFSMEQSPKLSAASVAYMVRYAQSTAITITLHADAYARAMADDDVLAALDEKTNVTLVSA